MCHSSQTLVQEIILNMPALQTNPQNHKCKHTHTGSSKRSEMPHEGRPGERTVLTLRSCLSGVFTSLGSWLSLPTPQVGYLPLPSGCWAAQLCCPEPNNQADSSTSSCLHGTLDNREDTKRRGRRPGAGAADLGRVFKSLLCAHSTCPPEIS